MARQYPHLCRDCGTPIPREGFPYSERLCHRCFDARAAAHPPFACTSDEIDRGMFWLEHGYYPDEEPVSAASETEGSR